MSSLLKNLGLETFTNELDTRPGSLKRGDNVVIDKDNIIEPRRGFAIYGDALPSPNDRVKQMFTYKNRILRHFYDNTLTQNKLQYDNNGSGTFNTFAGSYNEADSSMRLRGIEANGNFFFTTSTGIYKISANTSTDFTTSSGYIVSAGGVKALDVTAKMNYNQSGFFTASSSIAYRVVWGIRDKNDNVILGTPSARYVLYNTSATESGVVDLTITVPEEVISEDYFYQVYRSAMSTGTNDPGDELYLVMEEFVTTAEITAGEVLTQDIVPDDFRSSGALLYTNPNQEGIGQSNEKPPFAKDLALFKDSVFYANTKTVHRKTINVLSVDDFVSGSTSITITRPGKGTGTYTFVGETEIETVDVSTAASVAALDGAYFLLNSYENQVKYFIWFDQTGSTAVPFGGTTVGRLPVKCDISAAGTLTDVANTLKNTIDAMDDFNATVLGQVVTVDFQFNGSVDNIVDGTVGTGFTFAVVTNGQGANPAMNQMLLSSLPTVSQSVDETARSMVNVINKDDSSPVYAYYISGINDVPGEILFEARDMDDVAFSITCSSALLGEEFSPALPSSGTGVSSTNETSPNRIYYSKYQQPEAVPLLNYFNVGPKDKQILRLAALRDNLFVFKEDGIYRVSGQAGQFSVTLFDNSANLLAPDSVAILNNKVYGLTTQGVAAVSDTGVDIVSRSIEDDIIKLQSSSYVNFKTASFGVGYESDRAYLLWTVSKTNDTVATQCLRYNVFTNTWTKFPISKKCAVVNPSNDKLYLGAADVAYIEQERKSFTRQDYADREYPLLIGGNAIVNDTTVTLSSNSQVAKGDVITQLQYVTIQQFNQLLTKLDNDSGIADSDYFSTLKMITGDNLTNAMTDLIAKLNADAGTQSTYVFSNTPVFATIQTEFNTMIDTLNNDLGVFYSNYKESTGTITKEASVQSVGDFNQITVDILPGFLQGDITLYKGIEATVIYNPNAMGDPEEMKQVADGKIIFTYDSYTNMTVAYASDLSPSFEEVDFLGSGIEDWGSGEWGASTWGGKGTSVPIRTLIPTNKQRCRFLRTKITHINAREKFEILGTSLTPRPYSIRAYK